MRIVDSELFVNGEPQETIPEKQYCYTVRTSSPLTPYAVEQLGVTELQGSGTHYSCRSPSSRRRLCARWTTC